MKHKTTIVVVEQVIKASIHIADHYGVIRDGALIYQDKASNVEKDERVVQQFILG